MPRCLSDQKTALSDAKPFAALLRGDRGGQWIDAMLARRLDPGPEGRPIGLGRLFCEATPR